MSKELNGHVSFPTQRAPKTKTMTMSDETKIDLPDVNMPRYDIDSIPLAMVLYLAIASSFAGFAANSCDYVVCLCFCPLCFCHSIISRVSPRACSGGQKGMVHLHLLYFILLDAAAGKLLPSLLAAFVA